MRARWLWSLALALALACALPAASAFAAPPGLTPTTDAPKERPAPPAPVAEQVKKRIRALRASTLIDELQLDEATASKLFPIFNHYDDETEKLLRARAEIQRRLASASDLKGPAIDKLIDEAVANQRAFWDIEGQRLADLRKVLTPAQAAKLVVVLPALERKIQTQLRRALQQAKRKANRANRNAPAERDPDDDDLME